MSHSFYNGPRRDFYMSRLYERQQSPSSQRTNTPTTTTSSYSSTYSPIHTHNHDISITRARGGDGRFVSRSDMTSFEMTDGKRCGWCHTSSTSQWRVGPTTGSIGTFLFLFRFLLVLYIPNKN